MPCRKHCITSLASIRSTSLSRLGEADPDMGFMARLMALCSLPRTNPGDRLQYKRVNGPYTLTMFTSGKTKLPFGNLPRLLLAWVCTEAARTQSRELVLGSSLSGFMRKLGVLSSDSGGTWGIRTRLRNQMRRLFNAHVQLVYEDDRGEATVNSPVASRTELWWDPKRPAEQVLWESKIYLGEEFFHEIISHPVPLDMIPSRPSSALRWAWISTCGSPTAPFHSGVRYGSPGGSCTASSEWTRPGRTTSGPCRTSVARLCEN